MSALIACPFCRKPAGKPEPLRGPGIAPSLGDLSICRGCSCISVFTDQPGVYHGGEPGLTLRPPTRPELDEFLADEHITAAQDAAFDNRNPTTSQKGNRP